MNIPAPVDLGDNYATFDERSPCVISPSVVPFQPSQSPTFSPGGHSILKSPKGVTTKTSFGHKKSVQLPPTYINGLPDLFPVRENFTWFKKHRKSHRDQHLLMLSPQPISNSERPLNLYFNKIKQKTLLKDFQHQIITESRADEYRKKNRSNLERKVQSDLRITFDREGKGLQEIMHQTSNSNIVDYKIVSERSPAIDRKMVRVEHIREISPKQKPQYLQIKPNMKEKDNNLPTILSPNQQNFLEKVKNSSNTHAFARRNYFSVLDVQNNLIKNCETSLSNTIKSSENDNFFWQMGANMPLTTFNKRKTMNHVNSPEIIPEISQSDETLHLLVGQTIQRPSPKHPTPALPSPAGTLHSPDNSSIQNEDIEEQLRSFENHVLPPSKNKTIVVFKKGKNTFNQHAHVVVPLTLMTGDFSGSTQTQTRFSPKNTFKKTMQTVKAPSRQSITIKQSSPSLGTLKSVKQDLPRQTPEQSFVLQMPFKNYLSEEMQRTYMQKVRQIQNSSRVKQQGFNPFGISLADKIVEKTVGEGGTYDSADEGQSRKSQKKFISGLMQELKEHHIEDSDIQTALNPDGTPEENRLYVTTKSFNKMNKTNYTGGQGSIIEDSQMNESDILSPTLMNKQYSLLINNRDNKQSSETLIQEGRDSVQHYYQNRENAKSGMMMIDGSQLPPTQSQSKENLLNNEELHQKMTTHVLPNGSIINCSQFVSQILDKTNVKQYLRLAMRSNLDMPYIAISLPNEKLVGNPEEVTTKCLILLKAGQSFKRNLSKLQEIQLDSLQQQFIQEKEEKLKVELEAQKKIIQTMSWMQEQYEINEGEATPTDPNPSPAFSNHINIIDVNKYYRGTPKSQIRIARPSAEFELASSVQRIPTNDAPSNMQKSSDLDSSDRPKGTPYLVDQFINFMKSNAEENSTLQFISEPVPPIAFEDQAMAQKESKTQISVLNQRNYLKFIRDQLEFIRKHEKDGFLKSKNQQVLKQKKKILQQELIYAETPSANLETPQINQKFQNEKITDLSIKLFESQPTWKGPENGEFSPVNFPNYGQTEKSLKMEPDEGSPIFNIKIGKNDNKVEQKLLNITKIKVVDKPKNSHIPLSMNKDLGINQNHPKMNL